VLIEASKEQQQTLNITKNQLNILKKEEEMMMIVEH
jgi:hypothetical protein